VKADWGGQDLPFRIQKINNHPVEEDAADIIHKEVRKDNIELKTLNSTSVNTLTQIFFMITEENRGGKRCVQMPTL
jgi:hypothetical protein